MAILLFMIGNTISQASPPKNYSFINPNFGSSKCGTTGSNAPTKAADCYNDLRIQSNTCCMLTYLENNKNKTHCDSVPTKYLIGTNYKLDVANDVTKLGYTYVDYECGTVMMRPPQFKIPTKEMGINECGVVNANMPQKLEDCSLDKSLQHNTCCYMKYTHNGNPFSLCSAYASTNPWDHDYKGMVIKENSPLNITITEYVCSSNYLTTSVALVLLIIINFLF